MSSPTSGPAPAAFRHDPVKNVLPAAAATARRWDYEPVVADYRMLTYHNRTLDRTVPVSVSATPVLIAGVGPVVASDDGHVRLYSRDLSKVYWERRMDSSVYASPVLAPADRHVVVAATSGLIACFDLRGGLVWSVKLGTPVFATPTLLPGSGVLVVSAFHSRCTGLDIRTGAVVFEQALPEPWHAAHGGSASYRDPYAGPVGTAEGTAVVACAEHVLCLAPDGTELWRTEASASVRATPASLHATGEIAVCPVDGHCLFLDARTGAVRGELALGAKITGSPAVSGGVLAVGTQLDVATGVDIHTRTPLWTAPQGAPRSYTSLTVLPDGSFAATGERGNVVCLRAADGRFLWESSQVLGLPNHETPMDVTPVAGGDGDMYCASYTGVLYRFLFRPLPGEPAP
ncbi:PQQ-binding-like beta-propeller repeat protein [Streptomyces europaeiscabiei]|uniref:PQQ-binding-like beta-propeller repeat protein n=1 Tax=Streptomyces europaeiscabiei TaxID=146819 RepID=UPI0029B37284|nr:PQQ-binding-like beta-propeller repeat protein [Streptomyces europaeiscabiei]MDX2757249.1 PQQ-binding-like beta-propeller repeat protein [Streptomyces europaeiscabiei]